jgi:hypothetical protein
MGRVERWLFAPGDGRRLAAIRIGLCSVLAVRLARGLYLSLAGQPAALYRPLSFMKLLPSMPPRTVVWAVQAAGIGAAVLATMGLRTRLSLPVAWVCALVLNGMATSTGKVVHNDVLLLLALVPLLPAPCADAWSIDSIRRRAHRGPGAAPPTGTWSVRYGWPIRTAMVVVAGGYFFTGLNKLIFSGPAWALGDNLRYVLYAASDARAAPVHVAIFLADRAWLAHALGVGTLLIELGFPLVLFRPRAAWRFVPGAMGLHLGIWLTLHLDYWAWGATILIVFTNWPWVVERLHAGLARGVTPPRRTELADASRSAH